MRVSLRADKTEIVSTIVELRDLLATVPDTSTVHLYNTGCGGGGPPEMVIKVDDVKRVLPGNGPGGGIQGAGGASPGENVYATSVDAYGNRHWYMNGSEIK